MVLHRPVELARIFGMYAASIALTEKAVYQAVSGSGDGKTVLSFDHD
jgi:hypothetical protein